MPEENKGNSMKSQTVEMFRKVESKIETLASMRHAKLMPMLEEGQAKYRKISQNREFSDFGKRQKREAVASEMGEKLDELDAEFQQVAEGVPMELEAIAEFEEREEEREGGLEKQIAEMRQLVSNSMRQTMLLEELKLMTPLEIIRMAEAAHASNDDLLFRLLDSPITKKRIIDHGDASLLSRFDKTLNAWGSERIPGHRKHNVQLQARLAKIGADWRFFFNEVKRQVAGGKEARGE